MIKPSIMTIAKIFGFEISRIDDGANRKGPSHQNFDNTFSVKNFPVEIEINVEVWKFLKRYLYENFSKSLVAVKKNSNLVWIYRKIQGILKRLK